MGGQAVGLGQWGPQRNGLLPALLAAHGHRHRVPGAAATTTPAPRPQEQGPTGGPRPEDETYTGSKGRPAAGLPLRHSFIFVLMGEVQGQNIWVMTHANYHWGRHQEEQQKAACSKLVVLRGRRGRGVCRTKEGAARSLPGAAPASSRQCSGCTAPASASRAGGRERRQQSKGRGSDPGHPQSAAGGGRSWGPGFSSQQPQPGSQPHRQIAEPGSSISRRWAPGKF